MNAKNTDKTINLQLVPNSEGEKRYPVLVVISGNILDIGRICHIKREKVTIGRDTKCTFCLNDNQISRQHLEINQVKRTEDGLMIHITDLKSTNGTFINGRKLSEGWCQLGQTIGIGETILLFRLESSTRMRTPANPLRMISKDPLTSVFNRRAFDQIAQQQHKKLSNIGQPYTLLIIDVDHFKSINDKFGHPVGDKVLKLIARKLSEQVRSSDILARIGGDEFAVLLPGQLSIGGMRLAERLRAAVLAMDLNTIEPGLTLSISIGIATGDPNINSLPEIYKAADKALLQAKKEGRNRTIVAPGIDG